LLTNVAKLNETIEYNITTKIIFIFLIRPTPFPAHSLAPMQWPGAPNIFPNFTPMVRITVTSHVDVCSNTILDSL